MGVFVWLKPGVSSWLSLGSRFDGGDRKLSNTLWVVSDAATNLPQYSLTLGSLDAAEVAESRQLKLDIARIEDVDERILVLLWLRLVTLAASSSLLLALVLSSDHALVNQK